MLRESMQASGKDIAHAAALVEFAEAVVLRDAARAAAARAALRQALGEAGFVDAAAIVAAFHGFVRIADAIGIPYTTAAGGRDLPELREQAGINAFYRVQHASDGPPSPTSPISPGP